MRYSNNLRTNAQGNVPEDMDKLETELRIIWGMSIHLKKRNLIWLEKIAERVIAPGFRDILEIKKKRDIKTHIEVHTWHINTEDFIEELEGYLGKLSNDQ